MKKILKLLILLVFIVCLTACSKDKPTTQVEEVNSKAELCAEELININKFETYAWAYQEVQGKLNLTVDYICIIEMYGSVDLKAYYIKALCYITDGNDVDIEYLEEKIIY
jgi:hypothetical protein